METITIIILCCNFVATILTILILADKYTFDKRMTNDMTFLNTDMKLLFEVAKNIRTKQNEEFEKLGNDHKAIATLLQLTKATVDARH